MKKGNLIFLLFLICCKSQTKDYKVVYTSNSKIEATFYFHFNNMEFARTLGNSSKSDSLIFTKKKNDLIVRVFKFNENQKKRILDSGSIQYINYYTKLSDIKTTGYVDYISEVPVEKNNFLLKDQKTASLMEEHCLSKKNAATITFTNCKFIFPKDEKLPYLPENAEILSSKIIYSENNKELKEISISAKYLDFTIFYNRQYQYLKNNIEIRIMIKDNQSTENFVENFEKVNL